MNRMFPSGRVWPLAFRIALACTALAPSVSAAESPRIAEGRAHFSRGVEYFQDEDYRNAMVEFKRAYELAPNYKVLYNLGQTGLELKDYAFALKSLEEYLAKGENEIPAERRAEVSSTLRKLKQRVAEVTLTTDVGDAEVLIDEQSVGRTPLSAALVLSAGRHVITATKGKLKATRTVDITGGERTELSLSLEPVAPNQTVNNADEPNSLDSSRNTPRTSPRRDERHALAETKNQPGGSNNGMWAGIAITGALAIATGVTGGLAVAAKHDFDATIQRYPITPNDVTSARNKTRNLALATDILGGAALVSGGITIWLAVSGSPSGEGPNHVGITLTPNGLQARGAF